MHLAFAITYAVLTSTVQVTAYTPSPEACRVARTNCLNPAHPLMGTGIQPFVGAAACSLDFPLGTTIRFQEPPTVTVAGNSFTVPAEVICLDRFGRPTRNSRVDIVLLYPQDPGQTELALARHWGVRNLPAVITRPAQPWQQLRTRLWPVPGTTPGATIWGN